MFSEDFLKRFSHREPSAFKELEQMSIQHPDECARFCQEFILTGKQWWKPVLCGLVLKSLGEAIGRTEAENWIWREWCSMSELAKRTVLHSLGYPEIVLSTEFALELFRSPSSGTSERHLIVAGLAMTARFRHCEVIVLELINQVGRHDDPVRQATLEEFTADVKRSFGGEAGAQKTDVSC